MKIENGLFDHMVLQRTSGNSSDAGFAGLCQGAGIVTATVRRGGKPLAGCRGKPVGKAARGKFVGHLKGLPAGGPYEIELQIEDRTGKASDSLRVRDVLVGDVWILGGQSNMEGIGYLRDALPPVSMVRAFYMDDRWAVAKDPIHNLDEAVDKVHADLSGGQLPQRAKHIGVGPGVSFGQEMACRTGVPQGLICCGHGGTAMSQWDPALKKLGTRSLYGATIRRFQKNGGAVAGVVWYQGESDANAVSSALYLERMKKLVKAMRRDFGNARLPFVAVQISRTMGAWDVRSWNGIQDIERRLPAIISHFATVPAIDLPLDDAIHISGAGQNRLGRRLGQAMSTLRGDRKAGKPPIALRGAEVQRDPISGGKNIVVTFDNVMGSLQAPGRPAGFSVANPQPFEAIYRIDLDGNRVVLKTNLSEDIFNMNLHYGHGINPYCNITDSADRSLPVLGPLSLGKPQAMTDFVRKLQVSRALPSAGKLGSVEYPGDMKDLGFQAREFPGAFCDLHADLFACAPEDRLVFFRCWIDCAEPMRVGVGLGYDGPAKMWIDGALCHHNPNGTNPAVADSALVPFKASVGRHEILVAIGANNGRAWGMFLRFLRRDISSKRLAEGPTAYRMPTVVLES